MSDRSVLISGAGIAGPTLAYWLKKQGYKPVIVERARAPRLGGYVVDFWGVGYEVADRMGLLPAITDKGYSVGEVRIVGGSGKAVARMNVDVFRRATQGRYTSLSRGDLAGILYDAVRDDVETVFGDSVISISEDEEGLVVSFQYGPPRRFDLAIGADGLHSNIRKLAFGAEDQFERHLGYYVAAFETADYPYGEPDVYVLYNEPGKQVARFALRGGKTLFLFVFLPRRGAVPEGADMEMHKEVLRREFGHAGWETQDILAAMDGTEEIYFDRVSQIHMPVWSKSRVALLGDAAFCPSLLAGEGTSLAMGGAYVLAHMLGKHDSHEAAFKAYEDLYRPLIERKQKSAAKFAGAFAPRTGFGLFVRNMAVRLMVIPFLADWMVGRDLRDDFTLPD